ncbi:MULTISPECIES: acetylglutamate kinase [Corallincola]|uniref:Acetylglutamate kinase n=3 Tax=Corallincola TaxID=1775176 RepID=A0A368N3N9_9GAMM|nr:MULTISPECIES: acetylglutamate kinase [Corallincola]RCU45098.1 acetylglutamate kinase [Corallincola holothuriorum]TAA46857.1 acetylglutamate kinase [Corallincola spongiicola]TCI04503.1 acetylglutamate kinase [Corallincola luteus]
MSAPVLIKVGGALLENAQALQALFAALADVQRLRPVMIIHGGGCIVEQQLAAMGMVSEKKDGLRITPPEQMAVITGALAGTSNKQLLAYGLNAGMKAVGVCIGDAFTVEASVLDPALGCVGQCSEDGSAGDPALLKLLVDNGYTPIISSIAVSREGQLLNVNADQAALALCQLLQAELVLLSDVEGILDGERQLIPEIDQQKADQLVAEGVITDGMAVKVQAALQAARTLGRSIAVASWREPEKLTDLLAGKPVGTKVLG